MNALEQLLYDSATKAQESNRLINEIITKDKSSNVILDDETGTNVPSLARRIHLYLSSLVASGALDGADAVGLSGANISATGDLVITLTNGLDLNLGRVEGKDGVSIANAELVDQDLVISLSDATTINVGKVVGTDGVSVTNIQIEAGRLAVTLSDGSTIDAGDITQFGGVAAQGADITEAGDLVIIYTDGTVETIGHVVGAKGANGLNVVTAYVDKRGQLNLLMSDNTTINAGKVSKTVIDGTTKSVTAAVIDAAGHLVITLSDGETIDTGRVLGIDGTNGVDGKDVTSVAVQDSGELLVGFSDGTSSSAGVVRKTVIDSSNIGIADAAIDADGNLTLTVWDGSALQTYALGNVNGADGENGADGVGIESASFVGETLTFSMSDGSTLSAGDVDRTALTSAAVNASGELELTYTAVDGTTSIQNVGPVQGVDGENGISVTAATVDANGDLIFTLSQGTSVNAGKVIAETETNAELVGDDLVITFSDGTQKTFAGIKGTDGEDGDFIASGSVDASGNLTFTTEKGVAINAGQMGNLVTGGEINAKGELLINLTDGTVINGGVVTAKDGVDGTDGVSVSSIAINSGTLTVELSDGQKAYVTDIVGKDGTDGVGISDIILAGRDIEISLTDGQSLLVPTVKGEDGLGIDYIATVGDDLVFNMTDGTRKTFSDLIGKDGISISNVTTDGSSVIFEKTDGTTTEVPTVRGEDGTTITGITYDGTSLAISLSDGTVSTAPGFKGKDAVGIESMVSTDTEVTTTLTDGTVTSIAFTPAVDGTDGTGITNISINDLDHLLISLSDETVIDAGKLGTSIASATINEAGELELTMTDATVLNVGTVRAKDGVSVSGASLVGDTLTISLDDGTSFEAGDVSRIQVSSVSLETGDLIINLSDGTALNAGRVNGLDGRYITAATIDADDNLVLSMNRDGDIVAGNTRGKAGLAIVNAEVMLNGDLVVTMNDDTVVRAGNVGSGAGLTVFEDGKSYQKDRVVVHDGSMYIALVEDATTTPPNVTEWRAFAFGDEITEVRAPRIVKPTGTAGNLNPELIASEFAAIVSCDERDYREFQIDVASGDFSAPVYTASENADQHQVATALASGIDYQWRCRDVSLTTGFVSAWSEVAPFTAPTAYIEQPVVALDSTEQQTATTGAPLFNASDFVVAAGTGTETHVSTDWEVSRDGIVVASSLADTENLLSWYAPMGTLEPSTEYQVRGRFNDTSLISAWSDSVVFTTEADFSGYVNAPVVAYSGRNSSQAKPNPTFLTNPFSTSETDTHTASSWQVVRVSDGATVFESLNDESNLVSKVIDTVLESNVQYQVRAKHIGERFGESAWSGWQNFTIAVTISTPSVTTQEDVNEFPLNGIVATSAFSSVNDVHVSTDWEVRGTTGAVVWSSYEDTVNKTSIEFLIDPTYAESDLLIYARFNGISLSSEWSSPLSVFIEAAQPSGAGPQTLSAGDYDAGFYGETSSDELISGDDLASIIGLTAGISQNSTESWLKFSLDGKTLFVAKKPYRHTISWNHIDSVNAVYGDRTVDIGGYTFKVRLLKGAEADPSTLTSDSLDPAGSELSEWNRLMYKVHTGDPNSQVGVDWVEYTNEDLHVAYGNGRVTWCQETSGAGRVYRGYTAISSFHVSSSAGNGDNNTGWRPVLELVQ